MQLYALDKATPVLASDASKHRSYQCPECRHPVRLRGGLHRQNHFYHIRSTPSCRQHQKSLAHLRAQLHLKSLIPESFLEKSFPAIGRIADVAWEEKKLIFEIQCSPISKEEVLARIHDYTKAGYTVVWILHDKRFNKGVLTPSERLLRQGPCYFFSKTQIYDQLDIIRGMKRIFRGPPLPINPSQPFTHPEKPLIFQGDLFFLNLHRLKKKFIRKRPFSFKRFYLFCFHSLLEKFCI